ncbi:MAG: molybdenum cofactor guanylyltransferase [Armatimonadota bacterium]|nr:molybdenum cofactor guanylyltransferase [Armatimonadota bacterium]MDR7550010.1 molybdenum cofactor guanylyltransferase [Armatimonadota bacterium]
MNVLSDLTGVVLAGGQSRRLGTDKAFIEVEGVPMIGRVLGALWACCADVVIVAKDPARYQGLDARLIPDAWPAQAPLVGVCSGLRAMETPWGFVAACDLPFLSPDAVRLLARLAVGSDAAVPRVDGRWHPLHAVYRAAVAPLLEAHMEQGTRSMIDALKALRVRPVTEEELRAVDATLRTLHNVNAPQDLPTIA